MWHLAIHTARQHVAALVAVACAVLGGAAFLTITGVLAESGVRSHARIDRLALADVVVSADQTYRVDGDLAIALPERVRIPADLVQRVGRLPGVSTATGDISLPAAVIGADGTVAPPDPITAGHGWSSTALLDRPRVDGAPPVGPLEVALDSGTAAAARVRVDDRVEVVAAGHRNRYRVTAVLTTAGRGIYFADQTATRLRDRAASTDDTTAAVDLIAVRTAPGARDAVEAAVRDLVSGTGLLVSTGPARGDAEAPAVAAGRRVLPALAGSLAGVTLLVVGFIVAGALAVSIGAQRRDLALMRAVGATPRQVRRLAAAQATAVALAAVPLGVAAGYPLAERFRLLLVSAGMLPAALPLSRSPFPALAAVLLLVLVVQVSARCTAWRASRLPATEAVAESRSEPRRPPRGRGFAGVLLVAGGYVLAVTPLLIRSQVGAATTALAGILATIGLGLAGPALIQRISAVLARRLPARASAATWLAVANTHGYALRVAGAVTTLAMAVVFTLTYALTQTTVLGATAREVRAGTRADLTVTTPALGGLPSDLPSLVRNAPGVRAAAPVSTTTVLWPYRMFGDTEVEATPAMVLTPAAQDVLDLDVRKGSLAGLTGSTVAVSADAARSRDATVGRRVSLVLGDGARVTARVVAVYDRGMGFGPIVLSRDLVAGHTTVGLDQSILVRDDGSGTAENSLAGLAASHPGLKIGRGGSPGTPGGVPPELWINIVVLGVLLGYLLLGIANKLVAGTLRRRTELAALQLIGATPGQVRSMVRREAALVCAVALGTGVPLSAVPLGLLSIGFLHRPWPAGPVWLPPAVAIVVAGIAFLATELPARRALSTPPASALGRD